MELPKHPKLKNLLGMKFNHLLVVAYAGKNKHRATLWTCRCDCGREVDLPSQKIRNGRRSMIWTINGIEYPCVRVAGEALGVPTATIWSWCSGGAGKKTGCFKRLKY